MSKNTIGTLFIIGFIFISLIVFWISLTAIIYLAVCFIFNFELSIKIYLLIFLAVILFRMFYPKNVFQTE